MAKWKIVEDGTAVNFEQVRSIHIYKDKYVDGWSILADNVLVEAGFETEADAVEGIAKLVKELEGGGVSVYVTNPEVTTVRRGAFPGVDNAS